MYGFMYGKIFLQNKYVEMKLKINSDLEKITSASYGTGKSYGERELYNEYTEILLNYRYPIDRGMYRYE